MPLSSPKNYYWVGGSTGTTSASRFDWNVASNWRVAKNPWVWPSETNLIPATMPPVAGDNVSLGYYGNSPYTPGVTSNNRIQSPLLFGGFSGSGGTGCWICDGTTGSTFAGASGTTFNTSVSYLTVRPDYLNMFGTGVFGCGLTGEVGSTDVKDILVSMNVSGMDSNSWRYLSDNATTRQSSLNIKTRQIDIEGNDNSPFPSPHYIKPNIIDSYSALSGTTGVIDTFFRYYGNKKDVVLQLSNAKLSTCLINRSGGKYGGFIYVVDSYIGNYIDSNGNIPTSVNQNSFIGSFVVTIGETVQSGSFNTTYELAGTFKNRDTWRYLGTTGTTFTTNYEIDISVKPSTNALNYPIVYLGDLQSVYSGSTGAVSANGVKITGYGFTLDNSPLLPVVFSKPGTVSTMDLSGVKLSTTLMSNTSPITITTANLSNKSIIDFTDAGVYSGSSSPFDNWRFGLASYSASGLTLTGGIVFQTPDTGIIGDPGMRFINYGFSKSIGLDWRNNTLNTDASGAQPVA